MNKWIYALFGVLLLGGFVYAMTAAQATEVSERGRWMNATSTGQHTTEGGNITGVNVSGTMLTERWAAYYGNVSGDIVLTDQDGANNVYNWSWLAASGGEVCVSQNNSFPWASAGVATRAAVDTAFNFAAGGDQAADTYTDASCAITINEAAFGPTTGVTLNSGFENCVLGDGGSLPESFAFCTNITPGGTNYNGENATYEIMVPTNDTAGSTEIYYFFVELV